MPRQIPIDGGKFAIFPDDTPDDEMRAALESHTQQQSVWGALPPIAKALTQAFTPDNTMIPVPSMPKGTFGLSTEAVQGMIGQRQNAQQFNAQQAMQQRIQREKAMEAEQERAQQFKLEQMRFKNESGLRQLEAEKRLEAAKWSAELDANQPINIPGVGLYDPKLKQVIQGTQPPTKPARPISVSPGGALFDPVSGRVIHQQPRLPAQGGDPDGPMGGPIEIFNPETNSVEVRQYYKNGTYGVLGEPPPSSRSEVTVANKLSMKNAAREAVKQRYEGSGWIYGDEFTDPRFASSFEADVDNEYQKIQAEMSGAPQPQAQPQGPPATQQPQTPSALPPGVPPSAREAMVKGRFGWYDEQTQTFYPGS